MKRRDALRWLGTSSGLVVLSSCGGGGGGDDDGVMLDATDGTDALVLPDGAICRTTTNDVLGPFHRDGAPSRMMIASATEPGDRIALGGIVLADDCATPLVGAALDIWQADATGAYHEPAAGEPFRLRGKVGAAADGTWAIDTIRPGNYRNGPGWRPAHIHFIVAHPGYRTLTTQLYFAGDPFLPPNDSCTSCGSDDPARIIPLVARAGGGFTADFRIVLARA
jgi:protocatechuate 3,4-dioxygenase beta subunit